MRSSPMMAPPPAMSPGHGQGLHSQQHYQHQHQQSFNIPCGGGSPMQQQQQQHVVGGSPPPGMPSQESAAALHRAISSMEDKGLQDDPRYGQLLALRARTVQGMVSSRCVRKHDLESWIKLNNLSLLKLLILIVCRLPSVLVSNLWEEL
jgi:hypothetical protein